MASASSRAVSVAVQPQFSQSANPRRQQRASHSVTTSHNHEEPSQNSPYPDVLNHPAVEAYMAAHPRRTIPRFGPYLLLQTLGEGEFGKVKLGIHVQWGEEVAVKLIRRGNVDTVVRLSKVEREIEVLRVRFSVFSFSVSDSLVWFPDAQTSQHRASLRCHRNRQIHWYHP